MEKLVRSGQILASGPRLSRGLNFTNELKVHRPLNKYAPIHRARNRRLMAHYEAFAFIAEGYAKPAMIGIMLKRLAALNPRSIHGAPPEWRRFGLHSARGG